MKCNLDVHYSKFWYSYHIIFNEKKWKLLLVDVKTKVSLWILDVMKNFVTDPTFEFNEK